MVKKKTFFIKHNDYDDSVFELSDRSRFPFYYRPPSRHVQTVVSNKNGGLNTIICEVCLKESQQDKMAAKSETVTRMFRHICYRELGR